MSPDKAATAVSPTPPQPKSSSNSGLVVIIAVVLAVMCMSALAGVVLVAAGAFTFWTVQASPRQPDMAPMMRPAEVEMPRSVVSEVAPPAELNPTNP